MIYTNKYQTKSKKTKCILVKTNYQHHVSMDLYHEFENAIIKRGSWQWAKSVNSFQAKIIHFALKYFKPIRIPLKRENTYLIIGYQKEKFFPYFHLNTNIKALWMYDAWEPLYDSIITAIMHYGINLLFTSAKQPADYFNSLQLNKFQAHWIPEAVTSENYLFKEYNKRNIDLLQIGRKWESYHDKIKPLENELVYLYEKKKGDIVFKSRHSFIEGLASTKISICVPSNVTHPQRTGKISTLTNRYLQSMASKCLILGKAPDEMKALFGYNPVIEIDEENAQKQIKYLLSNYHHYMPLIEKNYETINKHHTWDKRAEKIEALVKSFHESLYSSFK